MNDGVEDTNKNGRDDEGETDASKADTDEDKIDDGVEKNGANPTNPEVADTDEDGVIDGDEDTNRNGKLESGETDPNVADSDGGGANDGTERQRGSNPLDKFDDLEARGGVWTPDEEDAFKAPIREQYEKQGHPYYASARLWDDGIIDPRDTRTVLGISLMTAYQRPFEGTMEWGVFRH